MSPSTVSARVPSAQPPLRLGVNIDHVATVRQARRGHDPDPVAAAVVALIGGADGITVHLREDRRHIQDRDLPVLRRVVRNRLNLEMAPVDDIIEIARKVKPDEATLVPERREELTTEGGLDVVGNDETVGNAIHRLKQAGIQVALFIDPDQRQVEVAHRLGAHAVELQTATYSEAETAEGAQGQLDILQQASTQAKQLGLHVHMGHGLNLTNVIPIAQIPEVEELNIGHSIISRAILIGMERAVSEMKETMLRSRAAMKG